MFSTQNSLKKGGIWAVAAAVSWTAGGCGAAGPDRCTPILGQYPVVADKPTTAVVAVAGSDLPPAVDGVLTTSANLMVYVAGRGGPLPVAQAYVAPQNDTAPSVSTAAAVRACVRTRATATIATPAGDFLAGLEQLTTKVASTAGRRPGRVVIVGAGSAQFSGIDIATADLTTETLRDDAVRTIVTAYNAPRMAPGVEVIVVDPSIDGANGIKTVQAGTFLRQLGDEIGFTVGPVPLKAAN